MNYDFLWFSLLSVPGLFCIMAGYAWLKKRWIRKSFNTLANELGMGNKPVTDPILIDVGQIAEACGIIDNNKVRLTLSKIEYKKNYRIFTRYYLRLSLETGTYGYVKFAIYRRSLATLSVRKNKLCFENAVLDKYWIVTASRPDLFKKLFAPELMNQFIDAGINGYRGHFQGVGKIISYTEKIDFDSASQRARFRQAPGLLRYLSILVDILPHKQ